MSIEDNTCKVLIDTQEYYIPCDRVKDLDFINGYLVNVSSQSIKLVSNFEYDAQSYPYINCSSMSVCTLRRSNNSYTTAVTSPLTNTNDYIKTLNFEPIIIVLLLLILGVKLIWKN